MLPLVDIGLTDLPKSRWWGSTCPSASPVPTALVCVLPLLPSQLVFLALLPRLPAYQSAAAVATPAAAAYVMRQSGWKAIKGPSMRLLSDLLMHP